MNISREILKLDRGTLDVTYLPKRSIVKIEEFTMYHEKSENQEGGCKAYEIIIVSENEDIIINELDHPKAFKLIKHYLQANS